MTLMIFREWSLTTIIHCSNAHKVYCVRLEVMDYAISLLKFGLAFIPTSFISASHSVLGDIEFMR